MIVRSVLAMLLSVWLLACSQQTREQREAHAAVEPPRLISKLPKAASTDAKTLTRSVYVPAYSRVYMQENLPVELAVSLSVRNTDDRHPIEVRSVRYYSSSGDLIEEYLESGSVELAPMATGTLPVSYADRRAGEGANFVVDWTASQPVSEPIIEAVMVSSGVQGISFVVRGTEIVRP